MQETTTLPTMPSCKPVGEPESAEPMAPQRETAPCARLAQLMRGELGQGTTEYAILVGVLVVIAILAIIAFRGKIQELWDAITSGINSL